MRNEKPEKVRTVFVVLIIGCVGFSCTQYKIPDYPSARFVTRVLPSRTITI